jgi:signal transduction histidine kinase
MRPGSLQGRLSTGLFAGLVAVFILQWFGVSLVIHRTTQDYAASRLGHDSTDLLAALTFESDGTPALDPARTGAIYHGPFSGHYYRIMSGDHVLRSRSLWDRDLRVPAVPPGGSRRLELTGPEHQPLLVLVNGYQKQGHGVTVAVAEDLSTMERQIRRFQIGYGLLSALALGVLLAVQRYTVRRALRPLETVRADIGRLEQGEIHTLDTGVPAEIHPLVSEVNRLLGLMNQRLLRSRNALGNLAHALKTPLTVISQLVSEKNPNKASVSTELRVQTEMIQRIVERELKRAKLAGDAAPGARFDANAELPPLLDALTRIHRDRHLQFESRISPALRYPGDREDLLELFGNLLDNACKWAHSRVRLTVTPDDGLRFTVEDDGPGCPPDTLTDLTRRGVRLDESTAGHGLGLAIASDIVAQYGGTLNFDPSPELGGLRVRVDLPLPPRTGAASPSDNPASRS